MTRQLGDVVLIRMRFQQSSGAKIRPALVLLDTGDDDFVATPITSRLRTSEYELAMKDWPAAGLNVPSWARVHKLTILAKADIVRSLGRLSDVDRASLIALLCRAFCPRTN